MKRFKVQVYWTSIGYLYIDAEDEKDATNKAMDYNTPLPLHTEHFGVDYAEEIDE